jgi:ribonuclease T1
MSPMRRTVVVLIAAILMLLAIATVFRRDLGGDRVSAPPPGGVIGAPTTSGSSAPATSTPTRRDASPSATESAGLQQARDVLAAIEARHGQPLAGYVGGRVFQNREGRLPPGRYHEYDVHPRTPGRDRGPERLVIDQATGRAYYSDDHYRTFVPLN